MITIIISIALGYYLYIMSRKKIADLIMAIISTIVICFFATAFYTIILSPSQSEKYFSPSKQYMNQYTNKDISDINNISHIYIVDNINSPMIQQIITNCHNNYNKWFLSLPTNDYITYNLYLPIK